MNTNELLDDLREVVSDTLTELEEEGEDELTSDQRKLLDICRKFDELDTALEQGGSLPSVWKKKK